MQHVSPAGCLTGKRLAQFVSYKGITAALMSLGRYFFLVMTNTISVANAIAKLNNKK
ncbi:hypothetical protein Dhaf_2021 [Desulfitobacterium hafniense DCB-2]|uniref:Uncharacterized protein n=1 Tax=Desulfitobacterium hafniense (strain DSM 10664 / DCB-2) TaxID=272564 RepID=B8FRE3_DESHD|nr:hypothetical protein Dhaf_2021 [Desulfitobacterium hafniense DCB-2]